MELLMPSAGPSTAHEQKIFPSEGVSVHLNSISSSMTHSHPFQPSHMTGRNSSSFLLSLDDLLADACDIASRQPVKLATEINVSGFTPIRAQRTADSYVDYAPPFKKAKANPSLVAPNPNAHSISAADGSLNKFFFENAEKISSSSPSNRGSHATDAGAAESSRRPVPAASSNGTTSPARVPSNSLTMTASAKKNESSVRPVQSKKRARVLSSDEVYVAKDETDASVARYLASGRWNDLVLPSGPAARSFALTEAASTLGLGGSKNDNQSASRVVQSVESFSPSSHGDMELNSSCRNSLASVANTGGPEATNEMRASDPVPSQKMHYSNPGCSSNCIAAALSGVLA
jgi:hypothetical protein